MSEIPEMVDSGTLRWLWQKSAPDGGAVASINATTLIGDRVLALQVAQHYDEAVVMMPA